jgi:RHS repeat-associated protein
VRWRFEGEAFGTGRPETDPDGDTVNTQVRLRLAGQYYDGETGLHYNGANYYDPKTGRWITPDRMSVAEHVERWRASMGVPGQPPLEANPFVRVLNNPLRWIDSDGLRTVPPGPKDPSRPPSGKEKQLTDPKNCTNKPSYDECRLCCGTVAGQIGTTGSIGTACAEQCARKEGITKIDQNQCPI